MADLSAGFLHEFGLVAAFLPVPLKQHCLIPSGCRAGPLFAGLS